MTGPPNAREGPLPGAPSEVESSPNRHRQGTAGVRQEPATLAAALGYVARGWPVLPLYALRDGQCTCRQGHDCRSAGKHSPMKEWQSRATTDPDRVRSWFRTGHAGVGVATGARSGLAVLDIDTRHGGERSVLDLQHRHGELPPTLWAQTGSGGWHAIFAHPGGAGDDRAARVGPGLDSKADGGMVVVAPTLHASGRRYRWVTDLPPAPMPAWLVARLRPAPVAPRPTAAQLASSRERVRDPFLRAALEGEARKVASTPHGGGLHDRVLASAVALGGLCHLGLSEADVVAALTAAAAHADYPPREVERTVRDGLRYGLARPRAVAA